MNFIMSCFISVTMFVGQKGFNSFGKYVTNLEPFYDKYQYYISFLTEMLSFSPRFSYTIEVPVITEKNMFTDVFVFIS